MRVLLDTHILLWALADDERLSSKARRLIEDASEIYISAASFWEMTIKVSQGRLDVDLDEIRGYCRESGFIELPIAVEHAIAVKDLEQHHRDPFDRILVATAITEPMRLITADPLVAKYTSLAILV
ncbi:type II toxin-antitoxin system VapC family toxin [Pseudomonas schmalbachii]|uniref:Type II toxin-antitoxin system VapC family toxin n=1 Tax=Pseudomonas schmalbachii TaxID=2816993 RepID=A0ABS3TMV6_9PSED|nr:type II toxin-antitoxin system VapC family toxin [Pseudomonas schmalbachii]MBO3274733.1 type II toxin-antitoxin system VapC family toxin [Pseudomonas schmalbachii]